MRNYFLADVMNSSQPQIKDKILKIKNSSQESFLIFAADKSSCSAMKELLDLGISNVNDQDQIGETALHKCTVHRYVEGVRFLLSVPNINVNVQSNFSATALHHAARLGYSEIVSILLNHEGIQPDLPDKFSWTPFLLSISSKSIDTIKLFLERKDIDFKHYTKDARNAIKLANETNNQEIIKLIQSHINFKTE